MRGFFLANEVVSRRTLTSTPALRKSAILVNGTYPGKLVQTTENIRRPGWSGSYDGPGRFLGSG
ncbi:hypothetical protein L210DRAFT_3575795 [Boletus edulis BED1]|uniref:Uncharacterized protein n=1 Tax=Boletus edulis BED1 TaxID=1328754 RepID=A0AAD4G7B9_BOLED|nr:hypothetical protein L210DRAFT_3575795 [Boletus edulis BED1]